MSTEAELNPMATAANQDVIRQQDVLKSWGEQPTPSPLETEMSNLQSAPLAETKARVDTSGMNWFERHKAYALDEWNAFRDSPYAKEEPDALEWELENYNTRMAELNRREEAFTKALKDAYSVDITQLDDAHAQALYMNLVEADPHFGFKDDVDGRRLFGAEAGTGVENLQRLLSLYTGANPNSLYSFEAQQWLESSDTQKLMEAKRQRSLGRAAMQMLDSDQEIIDHHEKELMQKEDAVYFAGLMAGLSPRAQKWVLEGLANGELDESASRLLSNDELELGAQAFRAASPYADANWWLAQGWLQGWESTKGMAVGTWRTLAEVWRQADGIGSWSGTDKGYEEKQRRQLQIESAASLKLDDSKLTYLGKMLSGVMGSLPYMAAMSNPVTGSMATMGMMNDVREEMILGGVDPDTALMVSVPVGITMALIEKMQFDALAGKGVTGLALRKMALTSLISELGKRNLKQAVHILKHETKDVAVTYLCETTEEVLQQITNNLGVQYATGDFNVRELAENAYETFVESTPTTLGFGLMRGTGLGPAIHRKLSPKRAAFEGLGEMMRARNVAENIVRNLDARLNGELVQEEKKPAPTQAEGEATQAPTQAEETQAEGENGQAAPEQAEGAQAEETKPAEPEAPKAGLSERATELLNRIRKNWYTARSPRARYQTLIDAGLQPDQAALLNDFFEKEDAYGLDNPYFEEITNQVYYGDTRQRSIVLDEFKKRHGKFMQSVTPMDDGSYAVELKLGDGVTKTINVKWADQSEIAGSDTKRLVDQLRAQHDAMHGEGAWDNLAEDVRNAVVERALAHGVFRRGKVTIDGHELSYDGILLLAKPDYAKDYSGATLKDVGHEFWHAATLLAHEAGILGEAELAKLREVFGEGRAEGELFNEEGSADAFGQWIDDNWDDAQIDGIFTKIRDFFRMIHDLIFGASPEKLSPEDTQLSEESIFKAITRGDVRGIGALQGVYQKPEKPKATPQRTRTQNGRKVSLLDDDEMEVETVDANPDELITSDDAEYDEAFLQYEAERERAEEQARIRAQHALAQVARAEHAARLQALREAFAADDATIEALGKQAEADRLSAERAQQKAAHELEQRTKKRKKAANEWGDFYRSEVAVVPVNEKGVRDLPKSTKRREAELLREWRAARFAERAALERAAKAGVPGAREDWMRLCIQEKFNGEAREAMKLLASNLEEIADKRITYEWADSGLIRVLGQFTLESKSAFIKRRMQQFGETKSQAEAKADGLYPESGFSAPWINKELYGDGQGGTSPDAVAQALYDDGLINDPTPDALWAAIEADVDSISKMKEREADAAHYNFDMGFAEANVRRRAALESIVPLDAGDAVSRFSLSRRRRISENQMDLFEDWLPEAEARRQAALAAIQGRGPTPEERKAARERAKRYLTDADFRAVFGFKTVKMRNSGIAADIYNQLLQMAEILDIPYTAMSLGGAIDELEFDTIRGQNSGDYWTHSDWASSAGLTQLYTVHRRIRVNSHPLWDWGGHTATIAHEWFHAFDNVLSYGADMPNLMSGRGRHGKYLSEVTRGRLPTEADITNDETFAYYAPRQEIVDAFKELEDAIKSSDWMWHMRSEIKRGRKYYTSATESTARLFEWWISYRQHDDADYVSPTGYSNLGNKDIRYNPSREDVKALEPQLKNLFKALKVGKNKNTGLDTVFSVGLLDNEHAMPIVGSGGHVLVGKDIVEAARAMGVKSIPVNRIRSISTDDPKRVLDSLTRYSISNLYTGSAADYDKPSLHYIGSGEGSQVYGWSLYASSRRGVAEHYASQAAGGEMWTHADGRRLTADELLSIGAIAVNGRDGNGNWKYRVLEEGWTPPPQNSKYIYEQTFYTNRPEGDESHLMSWYGPMSDEMAGWIADRLDAEGVDVSMYRRFAGESTKQIVQQWVKPDPGMAQKSGNVYDRLAHILGSPKAASEFLARAGIDGVKYPVNSYGKTIKDGNKDGWNYTSFRDDNIRVDHKWVDGVQRYSVSSRYADDANRMDDGPVKDFLLSSTYFDYSQSGHIYPLGKKPSRAIYEEGLEKWFVPGDRRAKALQKYDSEYHQIVDYGYSLDEWNGREWVKVAEQQMKPQEDSSATPIVYYSSIDPFEGIEEGTVEYANSTALVEAQAELDDFSSKMLDKRVYVGSPFGGGRYYNASYDDRGISKNALSDISHGKVPLHTVYHLFGIENKKKNTEHMLFVDKIMMEMSYPETGSADPRDPIMVKRAYEQYQKRVDKEEKAALKKQNIGRTATLKIREYQKSGGHFRLVSESVHEGTVIDASPTMVTIQTPEGKTYRGKDFTFTSPPKEFTPSEVASPEFDALGKFDILWHHVGKGAKEVAFANKQLDEITPAEIFAIQNFTQQSDEVLNKVLEITRDSDISYEEAKTQIAELFKKDAPVVEPLKTSRIKNGIVDLIKGYTTLTATTRYSVTLTDLHKYADAHKLSDENRERLVRYAVEARRFAEQTRDLWAHALVGMFPDEISAALATPEANTGKYPTISSVIAENFKRPMQFSAKVKGLKINSSEDVAAMMMAVRNPYQEMFKAIYLDDKNRVLDARILTFGVSTQTLIEPQNILMDVPEGAVSVIVSHNHPTGIVDPSEPDKNATGMIMRAVKFAGLELQDHVITNGDKYYSLKEGKVYYLPFDKQSNADWEITSIRSNAVVGASQVARAAEFLRQDGTKAAVLYLDYRRRLVGVRLLPKDVFKKAHPKADRFRAIQSFSAIGSARAVIVCAPFSVSADIIQDLYDGCSLTMTPLLDVVQLTDPNVSGGFLDHKSMRALGRLPDRVSKDFDAKWDDMMLSKQPWTRFSLSSPIERRRDLIGLHNMSAEGLKGVDDLGGFAMPSIAITKDSILHDEFGPVSLLMKTSAYDPKRKDNEIYSHDAWTPMFPHISRKVDTDRVAEVSNRLIGSLPESLQKAFNHSDRSRLVYPEEISDNFKYNDAPGEAFGSSELLKAAYLISKGETVEPATKPKSYLSGHGAPRIGLLGEDGLRMLHERDGERLMNLSYKEAESAWPLIAEIGKEAMYQRYVADNPELSKYTQDQITQGFFDEAHKFDLNEINAIIDALRDLDRDIKAGTANDVEYDVYKTRDAINSRVPDRDPAFSAWLNEQYGNPILARGIRNAKSLYTPSGNRRKWDALHDPVTLENVVRIMKQTQHAHGGGLIGRNPFGVAVKKFKSLKDVVNDEGTLRPLTNEEEKAIKAEFSEKLSNIVWRYTDTNKTRESNRFTALDNATDVLLDAYLETKGSFDGLMRELNKWGYSATEDLVRDFMDVMQAISVMPTNYFEAKPRRAVYFSEIAAAIIPDDTQADTLEILNRRGVKTYSYKAGDREDRLRVVNAAADATDARFSVNVRSIDYTKLPASMASVTAPTTIHYLTYGGHKDERRHDRAYAEGLLKSLDGKDVAKGEYILAKFHGDMDSAGRVINRVWLKDGQMSEAHIAKIRDLKTNLDPARPVVFLPILNEEGSDLNKLPHAHAAFLAKALGGEVNTDIRKTSKGANTNATGVERATREITFNHGDTEIAQDAQIVIVDDVYTSGHTVGALVAFLRDKGLDVVAVSTLAASRYGRAFAPTEKILQSAQKKSTLTTDELKKEIGYGFENFTSAELQAYVTNRTVRPGKAGARKYFGERVHGGAGSVRTDGSLNRAGQADTREVVGHLGQGTQRYTQETLNFPADFSDFPSFFGAQTGTQTELDLPMGDASDGLKRYSVSFRDDHVDLITAIVANRRRAGKAVSEKDVADMLRGVNTDPKLAHAIISTADLIVAENKSRLKDDIAEKTMSDKQFLHLATDAAKKRRVLAMTDRIGQHAYKLGREDAQNAQKLQAAKDKVAQNMLAAAEGFKADAMENKYGFNIVDTVANSMRPHREKLNKPEDPEDKPGQVNGPGKPFDPAEEKEADLPEPVEVEAPENAFIASINAAAAQRADAIDEKYNLVGGTSPEQARENEDIRLENEHNAERAEEDEDKPELEEEEGEAVDVEPEPIIKRERLDFKRASDFIAFVEVVVEKELRDRGSVRGGQTAFDSPVNLRELVNTTKHWLRKIAKELCASAGREHILDAIRKMDNATTLEAVECAAMNIYARIQERLITQSQKELVTMLEKKGKKLAEKGKRFSHGGDERDRKVRTEVEYWWRNIKRYFRMTPEAIQAELEALEQILDEREKIVETDESYNLHNDLQWQRAMDAKNALSQYGGLIRMRPAQIEEIANDILAQLQGSREELENAREDRRIEMQIISTRLQRAMVNPKAQAENKKPNPSWPVRMFDSMMGILEVRLRDLIRYSRGKVRMEAEADIQNVEDAIALASQGYHAYLVRQKDAFGQMLTALYGSSTEGMRRLTEILDDADRARITKQGAPEMTRAWLMQRYVELLQTDDYETNIALHKRDGKWRKEFDEVFSKYISTEDMKLITWFRDWYRSNLDEINEKVLLPISGIKQYSPGENYFPVKMLQNERMGYGAKAKTWSPYPNWLAPRVRHSLDFDERTNIIDMWYDRMKTGGASIHYAKLGVNLSDIFMRPEMKRTIKENHGDQALTRLTEHLMDIASGGGREIKSSDDSLAVADWLRGWQTNLTLSANFGSAFKQMLSCPVFALRHDINLGMVTKFMTDIDTSAIRDMLASDGWIARYGNGYSEAIQNAMALNASGQRNMISNIVKSIYNAGFKVMEIGDAVPCLWCGQGLYRYFVSKLRDEAGNNAAMTEQEIREKAMTRTWAIVEMTQQSKRIENLTAAQRGGQLGRLLYQFMSSPLQQLSYEVQVIKEAYSQAKAYGGWANIPPKTKSQLYRTLVINHILMPNLMNLAAILVGLPLGAIPDREEVINTILISTLIGQFGCIFMAGAVGESAFRALITGKYDYRDHGLPVTGIVDLFEKLGVTAHDLLTLNIEDLKDDILGIIQSTSAPGRQAVKAYRNYVEGANKRNIESWTEE